MEVPVTAKLIIFFIIQGSGLWINWRIDQYVTICKFMIYLLINYGIMKTLCGCNSVVECHLPMVNVVGSSPIARF